REGEVITPSLTISTRSSTFSTLASIPRLRRASWVFSYNRSHLSQPVPITLISICIASSPLIQSPDIASLLAASRWPSAWAVGPVAGRPGGAAASSHVAEQKDAIGLTIPPAWLCHAVP